jgi:hypothetical protein
MYESTGTHPMGEEAMKIALPPNKETTPILLMFRHTLLAITQIAKHDLHKTANSCDHS